MTLRLLLVGAILASTSSAETSFDAVQHKFLWPDEQGILVVTERGIEFRKSNEKESLGWAYSDIQSLDRISAEELEILTYKDDRRRLGEDRSYRFTLSSGKLTDQLFKSMAEKIGRPVKDRIVEEEPAGAPRLRVKHLKPFGGSEGELIFGESAIYYATGAPKQSREWRLDREIESIWAAHRYQLELHVFEAGRHDFDDTRVYRFQLKEPLNPDLYRRLKLKLYDLRAEDRVIP